MAEGTRDIRYAYVKNGDVIRQIERMDAAPAELSSGPDAFLQDFLLRSATGPVLLISRSDRDMITRDGRVEARVYADGSSGIDKLWKRPLATLKIYRDLIKYRPDRIVCSSSGGGVMWAAFAAARFLSIPFVHSRHGRVFHDHGPWYRRLGAWIDVGFIRRCDRVICHGPYLRHQLLTAGVPDNELYEFDVRFDETFLRPDDQSSSQAARNSSKNAERQILFVGRVEIRKGVTDLLDAVVGLMKKDASIRLVYAGQGAYLAELRNAVARSEFVDRIEVLGEVPHHELGAVLASSFLVVAPTRTSFTEGRCMVIMEAMLAGVPVVAPRFGPFPFLVKHGVNGLLYEPDSVEALRESLGEVLGDREIHAALAAGALESGRDLLNPPLTFSQAVNRAFSDLRDGSSAVHPEVERSGEQP